MTDFIKEQQELAKQIVSKSRDYIPSRFGDYDGDTITILEKDLDTLITEIITNIGKELLRRIEETDNTFSFTDSRYIKKDTMKQHITNVTGAYE